MPGCGTLLAQLTDQADFLALHRAIASRAPDDGDDIDHEFAFGLERVLDGIEVLIERERGPQRRESRKRSESPKRRGTRACASRASFRARTRTDGRPTPRAGCGASTRPSSSGSASEPEK